MARLQSNLQIGKKIGSGHFGEVHLGMDDVHGEVAVKIFRQMPTEDIAVWRVRKAVLLAEGQRLSQASHQNVVQVYQLLESETADEVHLVMELCSSGSLQEKFESGPMTLDGVRKCSTELALGLGALHSRGMLHRDIKPANLLVDNNGITKLGDFGLVTDNLIVGYASAAGYNDHLAPEVFTGGATSVKTDVWALGMTIYRLLHGVTWYTKSPPPQMLIPAGGFAKNLRWLPHILKPWRSFVRKALNDDVDYRFQNADEVINALGILPTVPIWQCVVDTASVRWQRTAADRQINVQWKEHSPRRHEWSAWSEALKIGRRRTLAGSSGSVSRSIAEGGLQDFFSKSA